MRRKLIFPVAAALLLSTVATPATAATGEVKTAVYETGLNGAPLVQSEAQYYGTDITEFFPTLIQGEQRPLPDFPAQPDDQFVKECRDRGLDNKPDPVTGYTINHYRWCKPLSNVWEKYFIDSNGKKHVTDLISFGTVMTGYADPRSRTIRVFHDIIAVKVHKGDFSDESKILNNVDCYDNDPNTGCNLQVDPVGWTTLEDVEDAIDDHGFHRTRSDIIDTSEPNLTGDKIAHFLMSDLFKAESGPDEKPAFANKFENITTLRCDSHYFNTTGSQKACIFSLVAPFLQYDRNNTKYPMQELVDHVRYAQDVVGAPGKFGVDRPVGKPMTRTYDPAKIRQNRDQARAKCLQQNGGKPWDASKVQCDEYPMASTHEGTASGGKASSKLINRDHNNEGGQALRFWYHWDRILENDWFWIQTVG